MDVDGSSLPGKAASLRWKILRRALLRRSSANPDYQSEMGMKFVSRKASQGFNLIPCHLLDDQHEGNSSLSLAKTNQVGNSKDAILCYSLPDTNAPKLLLRQRMDNHADLNDFEICNKYDIDNTGLVCNWPSEEVLSYYCLSNADKFRNKKVVELGSGYGLAGLVIAVKTEASEVVISDGNPQVVDYIQHNINSNSSAFGCTKVMPLMLHWSHDCSSDISDTFDVVVASDCTFFKEFHESLVRTIKSLLKKDGPSEAILLSPKRGDSLDKFLSKVNETGMRVSVTEVYDTEVWRRHQGFSAPDSSWPNYDMDHCYPLLITITH